MVLKLKSNIPQVSQKGLTECTDYDEGFPFPTRYLCSWCFHRPCVGNLYLLQCLMFPMSQIKPSFVGRGPAEELNTQPAVEDAFLSPHRLCRLHQGAMPQRVFTNQDDTGETFDKLPCVMKHTDTRELLQQPEDAPCSAEWVTYVAGTCVKAEQRNVRCSCTTGWGYERTQRRQILDGVVRWSAVNLEAQLGDHWFYQKAEFYR